MPRSILVTVRAGFIENHVSKALVGAGYRPVVYDNLSRGHRWAAKWGPLEVGDIADGPALRVALQRHRIEAVVHLAALAYVGESMRAPQLYCRNNVAGTLALREAMLDIGVTSIVFSSTCATIALPHRLPIPDVHPQQPVNPYGESKLAVERALRWYGEAHGLAWLALRYFNAAGADPDGELGEEHNPETHLVPLAIQAALGQRPCVDVYGTDYPTPDGTAVRDYIHVSDLADAHVRALDYLVRGGVSTAFNLGTGRGYSVHEIIRTVERVGRGRMDPHSRDAAAPRRCSSPRCGSDEGVIGPGLATAPGRPGYDCYDGLALAFEAPASGPGTADSGERGGNTRPRRRGRGRVVASPRVPAQPASMRARGGVPAAVVRPAGPGDSQLERTAGKLRC